MHRRLNSRFHGQVTLQILMLALLVLPFISFGQDAGNLIKNGGFAKGKAPWKGVGKVKPGMLEVPLNSHQHQEFSQPFNNKDLSKKFTITFNVKTSDDFEIASDERLDLMERKLIAQIMAGKTGSGSQAEVSKTSEWQTISLVAGISPAQKKSELVIYVPQGKGTIYFTDVKVEASN